MGDGGDIKDKQDTVDPTDKGDRCCDVGEILQGHGDPQQNKEGESFDQADDTKAAQGRVQMWKHLR